MSRLALAGLARSMWTACLATTLIGWAIPAVAHPVPFSYVDLALTPAAIEGSVVVHSFDLAHDLGIQPAAKLLDPACVAANATAIERLLGERLQLAADGRPLMPEWAGVEVVTERQSLRVRLRWRAPAPPGTVRVSTSLFPYDPNHETFLNIHERGDLTAQVILDARRSSFEYFAGTRQGTVALVRRFVAEGIRHILIGPDHLLFLVGLLLLGGTLRQLATIVTAFTVAHSVTLALAVLNIVSPPARLIEPAIALSIVYVGADNLFARGGRDVRAVVALVFGFIHGFGFANVLREMDLPPRALGWSLVSFNVGVEIGQLGVVLIVASALAALRARHEAAGRRLVFAGSVGVMAAGAFWFAQRVFFAGGMS